MKKLFLAIVVFSLPFTMQAQFQNLLNKAKSKVENRVNNRIDKEMDKTLDKAEGTTKKQGETKKVESSKEADTENEAEKEPSEGKPATLTGYSKFDFVPGEKIIYSEDFAQDVLAELPLSWNASGKGEVQTINGMKGKWMRTYPNNTYLSGNRSAFGENFTIEFDAIYFFQPKVTGYVLPGFAIGLFSSGTEDNLDNKFLRDQVAINQAEVNISPSGAGGAHMSSYKERGQTFSSDRATLNNFQSYFK